MKIKVIKDYYDEKDLIYQTNSIELKPGINILIGCNGSGKTTFLHQIKNYCLKKKIRYLSFDNYHEGGSNAMDAAGFYGDMDKLMMDFISSEGERIYNNVGNYAAKIGRTVKELNKGDKLFILLDAVDSGMSIDGIIQLKRELFDLIIEDCSKKEIEVYIIASANEYELASNERAINIVTGKVFNNMSYEDYKNEIIETRKYKNKRYKWGEWKY